VIWLGLAQLGEAFSLLWNHEEMRRRLGVDVFEHEHLSSRFTAIKAISGATTPPRSRVGESACCHAGKRERDLLVLKHHRGGDFLCDNFVEDGAGISVPVPCAHKRTRHCPLPQHTRIAVTLCTRSNAETLAPPTNQHQTLRKN